MPKVTVQRISAVTLAVADMALAIDFYREKVGLELLYGGGLGEWKKVKPCRAEIILM